jgi:hypothetical protein
MADKYFEQKIQERMEEFRLTSSTPVWNNIEAQLRKDKRRRWFFFLLLLAVLLGSSVYVLNRPSASAAYVQSQTKNVSETPANIANEKEGSKRKISSSASSTDSSVITSVGTKNSDAVNLTQNKVPSIPVNNATVNIEKIISKTPTVILQAVVSMQLKKTKVSSQSSSTAATNLKNTETVKKQPVPVAAMNNDTVANATIQRNSSFVNQSKAAEITAINEKKFDTTAQQLPLKEPQAEEIKIPDEKAAIDSPAPISAKRESQKGWGFNAGIADVRSSIATSGGFASADSYVIPQTGSIGMPNAFGSLVTNEYSVKSNLQAGVGYNIRFPLGKKSWFVTGLQYQYNRYTVIERLRRDTFFAAQNRLESTYSNEGKNSFGMHYISIPTEIQWHIAQTTKGKLMLGAGMLHSFKLAAPARMPSFVGSSSGAAFYQPILQFTPAYEWDIKKSTLQLGWYFNYGLLPVYNIVSNNHWWQTGLRLQMYVNKK